MRACAFGGSMFCGVCERRMQGQWVNHAPYDRFRFPAGYALASLVGLLLATRPGPALRPHPAAEGVRSAAASLREVASSPVKLALLVGGSALVTLVYSAAWPPRWKAFGGGIGFGVIGR
jgi:hypothetical protein